MADKPAHAIQTLRYEHEIMARLLDLLESEIKIFENAEQPDYELIKEVADYFLTYPDLCHHPKEGLILRMLEARDRDAARGETFFPGGPTLFNR